MIFYYLIQKVKEKMSNYDRSNRMVMLILVVLILGAFSIGTLAWVSTLLEVSNQNLIQPNERWSADNYTFFYYERNVSSVWSPFTIIMDTASVDIDVEFVDNSELLYEIEIRVHNNSLATAGDPVLNNNGNHVSLDYPDGDVTIILGSTTVYAFEMYSSSGDISLELDSHATVSNMKLETASGDIEFLMTNDVSLNRHVMFEFEVASGDIDIEISLLEGIGGDFYGSSSSGQVYITTSIWNDIVSSHYRTPDFSTAAQTLTITSITASGDIIAILS
jgi:hypothetical protein